MSLATVLTHLDNARDALAAALTEKGLTVSETITINGCAEKIGDLPDVGAVDVSDTTATADKVLSGYYFYNAAGQKTEGTATAGGGGTDVSDTTAVAGDVLSGKIFHLADGTQATGTIQTVTASLSANVATVPAGYIASAQTLTVAEAGAASVSGNVVTIPTGYIASQRTVTVGTAKAAATYTPTTSDQTIAAGQYLTGTQTVKGDANLVAANIKSGVTIFGVSGSYSGGSSSESFIKCTSTANDCYDVRLSGVTGLNGIYLYQTTTYEGKHVYLHQYDNNGMTVNFYIVPIADPYGGDDILQIRPNLDVETEVMPQEGEGAYYVGEVLDPAEGYSWSRGSLTLNENIPTVFKTYEFSGRLATLGQDNIWAVTNEVVDVVCFDSTPFYPPEIGKIYSAIPWYGSIDVYYPTGVVPVLYDYYKCASVDTTEHTWRGYKATLSNGVYTFAQSATSHLTYDPAKTVPVVNHIYTNGALVEANLYTGGMPTTGRVFYAPLSASASEAVTGQTLTTSGTITYATVDGIACASNGSSSEITYSDSALPSGTGSRTVSFWLKAALDTSTQWQYLVGYGTNQPSADFNISLYYGNKLAIDINYDEAIDTNTFDPTSWHHIAITYDGTNVVFYIDGTQRSTQSLSADTFLSGTAKIYYGSGWPSAAGTKLAAVRIYSRVLTSAEITQLAGEFLPVPA